MSAGQLLRRVPHSVYHADTIEEWRVRSEVPLQVMPNLSRSVAYTLLTRSPYHAHREHPALGGGAEAAVTDAMNHGNLYHSLFLGGGQEVVPVRVHTNPNGIGPTVPAVDYRKPEAQAIKRDALRRGAIPVLPHELAKAEEAIPILKERIEGLGVPLQGCEREVTALWDEIVPAGVGDFGEDLHVACKARFDLLVAGETGFQIWDPKFPDPKGRRRASPYQFQRALPFTSYPMQAWGYVKALETIYPDLAGSITFAGFLWCETWEPFDVALIPVPTSLLALGKAQWDRAVSKWGECLATGLWPGYGRLPTIEAPAPALEGEMASGLSREERIESLFGLEED